MAQQDSILKLKGRIGDLSFYKTKDGYQARQATGVDPARIATDPKFQRTRENNLEFATTARAAKQVRDALRPVIGQLADSRMSNRLSSRMMRVVKADSVNDRGQRQVLGDNIGLLRGFNFNDGAQLNNTLFAGVTGNIDRTTGALQVQVEAFDPKTGLAVPEGATHFQFTAAGMTVDFAGDARELVRTEEALLNLTDEVPANTLEVAMTAELSTPIFLLFGIAFYQEVNAKQYPLKNGARNVLLILEVSGA